MSSPSDVDARFAELERLVRSGQSLSQAVNKMAPPPPSKEILMRRAAAVRLFDEGRYRTLIVPGFDTPFRDFVNSFEIERTRAGGDLYRVVDPVAAEHLQRWLDQDRSGLIEFLALVYNSLKDDEATSTLERFRFLVAANPAESVEEFDRLFEAADKKFDLGTCHALLQTLRDLDNFTAGSRSVPLRLLPPELRGRCEELTPYVLARGRFIEEHTKSANYLQRDTLFKLARGVLDSKDRWLLPIYGGGGNGKTMFLRWLVARHCVPRPQSIAVARVDFDDINVSKLHKCPWLLLVPLAEQLNRQLPGAPFDEYLDRYVEYWPVLLPASRIPHGVRVEGLEADLEQRPREKDAVDEFAETLAGQRAVLILDTLEEATLHFPESLRQVVRVFREVRASGQSSSRFKLILAGRYNLKEKGFLEPGDPDPVCIGPFTTEEARAYLSTIRHINSSLIPAIVAKADGNPFVLSLIADLVLDEGITEVARINELEPEFAYLIRRVIDRIPDSQRGVRWVVRYGVVPQRLSKGFVQHVMALHLTRELADDESQHMDALLDYRGSFPRGGAINIDDLWTSLRNYADTTGWLRADEGELRFQPEVVRPMRALLAKEERLFRDLHRDAAAWFEAEAEREPSRRGVHLAEVFYHRLQLHDDGLEPWLISQLSGARAGVRRALLEAIAVLLPADRALPAINGRSVLSPAFVASARVELSLLLAGIAWGPCRLLVPASELRRHLPGTRAAAAAAGRNERVVLIELALAVNERDFAKAAELANDLERTPPAWPEGEYAGHLLRARARIGLKQASAEESYAAAASVLARSRPAVDQTDSSIFTLWSEAGRGLIEIGEFGRGLDLLKRVVTSADAPAAMTIDVAEACLEAHEYAAAANYAQRAELSLRAGSAGTPSQVFRIGQVAARCEIARGRLLRADVYIKALRPPDGAPLHAAQLIELRGLFAAAAYDIDEAVQCLHQAAQSYATIGDQRASERALLSCVRALKELKGDWAEARRLLQRWTGPQSSLLAVEQFHLDRAIGDRPDTVGDGAPAALQLLSRARRRGDADLLSAIAGELEAITPPTRRLDHAHFFRWVPRVTSTPAAEEALRRALVLPQALDGEFFPQVFDAIELFRAIGSLAAQDLLRQAVREIGNEVFLYERVIEIAQRMNADLPSAAMVRENIGRMADHGLAAATAIRYQTAVFDHDDNEIHFGGIVERELVPALKGTQFEAMHYINKSRALWQSNRSAAEALIRDAAAILRVLGREAEAKRLLARVKAGDLRAPKQDARRIVVSLKATDTPGDFELGPEISFQEAKLLAGDPDAVIRSMRAALPDDCQTKPVVELRVDDAATAALPWEWAISQNQLCFRSAHTLPFATTGGLKRLFWFRLPLRWRRAIGYLTPVRVLVIQPSVVQQQTRGRGFERHSNRSLSAIYKSHGLKIIEAPTLTLDGLSSAFIATPQIIHIQAPFSDRRGKLRIDLPIHDTAAQSPTIVDAGVEFWAQQFQHANLAPPVVILDPPRPPAEFEVGRQLLLRNRFAADLVATGTARAVIGTGLFEPMAAELAAERMALEMSANPSLRRLLELLQQGVQGDQFSTIGAALFVADPEAPLK